MKKPLFVKKSTNSKTKAVSSEGTNAVLSSKPSYMLDVMGVNLATSKVYSEETVGDKESMEEEHESSSRSATSKTLEQALEQAIKDENYELAAKIRDQINQRNKNQ
jgi:excinuclease UvrABC helicase subunit UvrB